MRSAAAVVAANLALFIGVVSLPSFQASHHHWIFPVLAGLLAVQWALTFRLREARAAVVSLFLVLLSMGILRHQTILACFDRCSFKLSLACAIAALVFLAHRFTKDPGFWSPLRSSLAALGAALWSAFLALRGLGVAPWGVDGAFVILALLLWLRRDHAVGLLGSLGILTGLAIRATANEFVIIGLALVWSVGVPLWAAPRLELWLKRRASTRTPSKPWPSWARILTTVLVAAGIGVYVVGPMFLMTDPDSRRELLLKRAPKALSSDPAALSPLAARLRAHVFHLSRTIGERDTLLPKKQDAARDYVLAQFKAMGYKPQRLEYLRIHSNVEAVLPIAPAGREAWVLGAHYDSAPGTPGADDNASGVAVLLEVARLLHERRPDRDVRFVAFGTEEPPSFGTRNMGSWAYAKSLKDNGAKIHGMISLEMLGYYNPAKGSQLYPPFLHLWNPDRGDYVGAVGNVESRELLGWFAGTWRKNSGFPLTTTTLPGPFATLALSDQLNFWAYGYRALLLSDTAFYRNPHYHQASDLPETLDYERMAAVAFALARVLEAPKP